MRQPESPSRAEYRIADALNVSPAQVGKLAPEKQQKIISEKPQITHKEVKDIQRQENTSVDVVPETDDEEETTYSESSVILSHEEAETLSKYILNIVVVLKGFEENKTPTNGFVKPIHQHSSNVFIP